MKAKFDEKVMCGDDYIALREIDSGEVINSGGLVLAKSSFENSKLGRYSVESIGRKAAEASGLVPGDFVFADRLASFYHSAPVCLMDIKNVILKTDTDGSAHIPLRNSVFVVEDKKDFKDSGGGFYVQNDASILRLGTITDMNIDESDFKDYPFAVGDHVMLVRGGDFVKFGQEEIFIFKPEQIICKIVKGESE